MSGPATFAARWAEAVAAAPDRPFLAFEAPSGAVTRWTYGEFDDVVARAAGALASRGVEHGCAVHLTLTNCPAFVAAWLAAARLGAWIVPSDPGSTAPELAGHIDRTKPVVGLCGAARAAVYREAASGVDVIEVDEADALVPLDGAPVTTAVAAPRDRLAVMFTSGTTSAPKGVEVTQANYAFAGDVMAAAATLRTDD